LNNTVTNQFLTLPDDERLCVTWPTANHRLFDAPEKFFACTRVNLDYGKPGWTRDCGKRLHRGCDIAPVNATATGRTTRVVFTNCATNADFESEEPTFVPHDDVFCVCEGIVTEVVTDESISDFGKHIVIEHAWPRSGTTFFTLYAHLSEVASVSVFSRILQGAKVGQMGQTSRSADARNWMAISPHLHFEVKNVAGQSYDPVEFLKRYLPPAP
jgi:murein DD-endopeptidase MepM/ murein hydrolase activator NlpD